jgi:hypothetical protein
MNKRRKKMALGVVVLGAAAMIADRTMFGTVEPAPASAAAPKSAPSKAGTPSAKDAKAARDALVTPELVFPKSIPQADSLEDIRDWFAPHALPTKVQDGKVTGPTSSDGAPAKAASAAATFEEQYRLDAVVIIGAARMAVVGGRWLRVGDTLEKKDGRLVEVLEDSAVFEFGGEKKTLRVFPDVFEPES